VKIPENYWKY